MISSLRFAQSNLRPRFQYLSTAVSNLPFQIGEKVELLIQSKGTAQCKVLVNNTDVNAIIFTSELKLFETFFEGKSYQENDKFEGYISTTDSLGRLVCSLRPKGEKKLDIPKSIITKVLQERKSLPLHENSTPKEIRAIFPGLQREDYVRCIRQLERENIAVVQYDRTILNQPDLVHNSVPKTPKLDMMAKKLAKKTIKGKGTSVSQSLYLPDLKYPSVLYIANIPKSCLGPKDLQDSISAQLNVKETIVNNITLSSTFPGRGFINISSSLLRDELLAKKVFLAYHDQILQFYH